MHNQLSAVISSQKLTAQAPIIRSNVTYMFAFILRNYSCIPVLLDELSALIDNQTTMNIHHEAMNETWIFPMIKHREKRLKQHVYDMI